MEELTKAEAAAEDQIFAQWIGRRQAYSLMAGTCSAADAKCLYELRQGKTYRKLGMNWEQFCKQRIGLHRSKADEIIRLWTEFGPTYFTLNQMTGITAEEFRAIRGSITGGVLIHKEEHIPISAEFAPRLLVAVRELNDAKQIAAAPETPAPTQPVEQAFESAERLVQRAIAAVENLRSFDLDIGLRCRLQTLAGAGSCRLRDIQSTVRI